MIEMECLVCAESIKTRDVQKAVAFNREHKAMHEDARRIRPGQEADQ